MNQHGIGKQNFEEEVKSVILVDFFRGENEDCNRCFCKFFEVGTSLSKISNDVSYVFHAKKNLSQV